MKIDAFLTCLGYYGVSTGASTSLEGAYSLSSGVTGVFYNQLYSTGSHFVNGQIYAPTVPLLNVWNNTIINNTFSGVNALRVGFNHTGSFSLVMDIEYSGCNRPTTQKGMVLLSTVPSPSGLNTGFYIGITEANRLYFQTSGYTRTLEKELGVRDFVYVGLGEKQYINFGIYSLEEDKVYSTSIKLSSGTMDSDSIFIGNFLTTTGVDPYTGFVGKVNQAVLFADTLTPSDIGVCANCALTTGFNQTTGWISFLVQQVTGMYFSGVLDYLLTGYRNITGTVLTHNGSPISVVYPSGMSGLVTTGQMALPMFTGVTVSGMRSDVVFQYDTGALRSFSIFSLYLNAVLTSGDTIEVYSYPRPNTKVGKKFNGIAWPTESGFIQVISNGLTETSGVDYAVVRNEMSGEWPDDILTYDLFSTAPIVTAYSGYWSDGSSRISISGGGYYPPTSQYSENTGSFSGVMKITGLSGVCTGNPFWPTFGWDLFMNGQKLISGMQYSVVTSGASVFVVSLSGNILPQLVVYPLYDSTGGGPTGVESVDDSELSFLPQFSGFQSMRTDITTSGSVFGYYTGFGEQVWVNGLRLVDGLDYIKVLPCSNITGTFSAPPMTFPLVDTTTRDKALWNVLTPPRMAISLPFGDGGVTMTGNPSFINTNGYSTADNCIEVWVSSLVSAGTFGPFVHMGRYPYSTLSLTYTGYYNPGDYRGTGIIMARYHKDNIIGQFTTSQMIAVYYYA